MVGSIRFIADITESVYERTTFSELLEWLQEQDSFELDIETNITTWWHDKVLISIQFGSTIEEGSEKVQWFVQWSALTSEQQEELRQFLNQSKALKLAHNAKFEYIVLRFYGIVLSNLYDTMLAEKVLRGGEESEDYALADISWKYLKIVMDKSEQMNFGDNMITDSKILYGVTDVAYLSIIRNQQLLEASTKDTFGYDLMETIQLEMNALLSFSDITFKGMLHDSVKWRENIKLAEPLVQQSYDKLNAWLITEPFHSYALRNQYVSSEDRVRINYNSVPQRTGLLKTLFPDITGATLAIVKKYLKEKELDDIDRELLQNYLNKDYDLMQERLLHSHRKYLIDHEYLIPAGQVTINWSSQQQVLPLFQQAIPKLKSLAKEERAKHPHAVLKDFQEYGEATKLITTYGEEFIQKYVSNDGKVRTNFNQVLTTGRVSSSNPNMQNIPAKENVGMRYRNAFIADEGFSFVDSDYTGQELAIIAYMSKDPVWLRCIENNEDLHSVCAEMVYGRKWQDSGEKGCRFYEGYIDKKGVQHPAGSKHKCECKKHKLMRSNVKPIDFGLAYGMSEFKLAGDLGISVREARNLIETYFSAFPNIEGLLDWLGRFGVENGFIMTLAPFNRKRYFPFWQFHKEYIFEHVNGIRFNPTLGEIERASKNMPIQGTGADMVKLAMCMMRDFIHEHGLQEDIFLVAQVHDQITTMCRTELADWWKVEMDRIMVEAAKVIIPTGILKAETTISSVWTK